MGVVPSDELTSPATDAGDRGDSRDDPLLQRLARAPAVEIDGWYLRGGTVVASRYRLDRKIGEGGMGVVWAATDLSLGRTVAIKCQRSRSASRDRVRREGSMLARLSHPNIVSVLDVVDDGHAKYVVMEYLPTGDLARWLSAVPRSLQQVLEMFVAAGEGLAAMHELGLVHRDFKPHNVLVDVQGRAKVGDFGLARAFGESMRSPGASDERTGDSTAGIGTIGYAAPEQLRGEPADPRADQYSFCVSLRDALAARSGSDGSDRRLSRAIRRAIARGLAEDPGARHPSMRGLLDALRGGRRGKLVLPAALLVGGIAMWAAWPQPQTVAVRCEPGWDDLSSTWNGERRRAFEARAHATGAASATFVVNQVRGPFDRFVRDYATMARDTCAAPIGDTGATARQQCLDAARTEFTTIVDGLDPDDRAELDALVTLGGELPELAACDERRTTPRASNQRIAALRADLARAAGLLALHRDDDAKPVIDAVLHVAHEQGEAAVLAEAMLVRSRLQLRAGQASASLDDAREAYHLAYSGGDDVMTLSVAVGIAEAHFAAYEIDEAEQWLADAERRSAMLPEEHEAAARIALLRGRIHVRTTAHEAALVAFVQAEQHAALVTNRDELAIDILQARGDLHAQRGDFDQAQRDLRAAYDRVGALHGEVHPDRVEHGLYVAAALARGGDLAGARTVIDEAMKVADEVGVEAHPARLAALQVRAELEGAEGQTERSLATLRELRGLLAREADPSDTRIAAVDSGIAIQLELLGRVEEALEIHRALIASGDPTTPEGIAEMRNDLMNAGVVASRLGLHDEAEGHLRRALELDATLPTPDVMSAMIPRDLGVVLLDAGKLALAEPMLRRAIDRGGEMLGAEHPDVAWAYAELGRLHAQRGQWTDAIDALQRATAGAERGLEPQLVAEIESRLADARESAARGDPA